MKGLSDVALDPDGNLYLIDELDRRVRKVTPGGEILQQVGLRETPPGYFKSPRALTVDRVGNVYVVDAGDESNTSRIQKLSPGGEPLALWDRPGESQPPRSIAVDDAGNIYIADGARLQKFSAASELVHGWDAISSVSCSNDCFAVVAVDHAGNLYVRSASYRSQHIYRLSPDDGQFVPWGGVDGETDTYVPCLGVDDANNVYACAPGRISRLSPNGELLGEVNIAVPGRLTPEQITVDREGNIYAGVEYRGGRGSRPLRLWKFSSRGDLLQTWDTQGSAPGELGGTFGLSIDRAGNLLIADAENDRIQVVSPSGQPLMQWGRRGGALGELRHPWKIAVGADGTVYVLENQQLGRSNPIQRFTPNGEPLGPWDPIDANPGQPRYLQVLTVDRNGNLYLAARGLIEKFLPDGNFVTAWGGLGSEPGMFRSVEDMTVDPDGNLFVADTDNNRVQRLSPDGEPIARWGSDLYDAVRIRVDDAGNLFILDAGPRWLQMRSPTGAVLAQWEIGDVEWDELTARNVDSDRNRYATSVASQWIERRSAEGALLATWDTYIPDIDARSSIDEPVRAIAQDDLGNVYIGLSFNDSCGCDAREIRILKLLPSGETTTIVSRLGRDASSDPRPSSNPRVSSLLAGPVDTLFVTWGDGRIEMLSPTGESLAQWGVGGTSLTLDSEGGLYVASGGRIQQLRAVARYVPEDRYEHTAIWTGTDVLIWGGQANRGNGPYVRFADGARYDLRAGPWAPLSRADAPSPRTNHTAVWSGTEMLVWGGRANGPFGDGARYNPGTNTWRPMSSVGAPSPRELHTAVWTGREMIVWGGAFGTYRRFDDGARFDPLTDTWSPLPTSGAPSPRAGHAAVWTGTELLVWGGAGPWDPDGPSLLGDGAAYDPLADTWRPIASVDAPSARSHFTAVWTGSEMLVWGGSTEHEDGGRYDSMTDTWSPMSVTGAPSPRWYQSAVWTGSELLVWGGSAFYLAGDHFEFSRTLGDGARYSPTADSWAPTSATNAPRPRWGHSMTWTGSEVVIWGGSACCGPGNAGPDYGSALGDGALYDPRLDAWTPRTPRQ